MFEIACYQADLSSIVVDVFRTMLSLDVETLGDGEPQRAGSITAAVHLAGEWRGAVLLQTTPAQACALSARLIAGGPPVQFDDNVRDALGELANMVAGNLKSVLPPGVALSLPTVVEGSNYALRICGNNLTKCLRFLSADGEFMVTLVEVLEK